MTSDCAHKPFVVFEGPIAAGKTTMAALFSRWSKLSLLEERFSENDFLADFYEDRQRWALPMQMWFLVERHRQMLQSQENLHEGLISDYSFQKNEIFAGLLLKDRELSLFKSVAGALGTTIKPNDLVVYLDASNAVLLNRIKARGRPYEEYIDAAYLNSLRLAYEAYLSFIDPKKILCLSTEEIDLRSESALNDFYGSVRQAISVAMA